jgi:8-oxo-dGTP diphosphatase
MRIAVISDIHHGQPSQFRGQWRKLSDHALPLLQAAIDTINRDVQPDWVLHLGDAIQDVDSEQDRRLYAEAANVLKTLQAPLLHVTGNHDEACLSEAELDVLRGSDQLRTPLDCGPVTLLRLASHNTLTRCWIEAGDVARLLAQIHEAPKPVVVVMHHSLSDEDLTGNPWFEDFPQQCLVEDRAAIRQALEATGRVRAVLNGHLHWNRLWSAQGSPISRYIIWWKHCPAGYRRCRRHVHRRPARQVSPCRCGQRPAHWLAAVACLRHLPGARKTGWLGTPGQTVAQLAGDTAPKQAVIPEKGAPGEDEESLFLKAYRQARFARPAVTVDLVIFTVVDADLKVLLILRREPPFKGRWALPGGFVRVGDAYDSQGEDVDQAAVRELSEETGLAPGSVYLEQLHTFGKAGRDPRMRIISVAYTALVRPDLAPFVRAGGDAAYARWFSVSDLDEIELAFDHTEILQLALARLRERIDHGSLAFELVPPTFTIPELRAVFEVVKGSPYDPGNFRRRFQRMVDDGVIQPAQGKRITASKPAKVYRFAQLAQGESTG